MNSLIFLDFDRKERNRENCSVKKRFQGFDRRVGISPEVGTVGTLFVPYFKLSIYFSFSFLFFSLFII